MQPTRRQTRAGVSLLELAPSGTPTRTALLLHGIGGSARSFAALAAILVADGVRCLSWDAPGYGESPDPARDIDPPDVALQVCAELGLEHLDLVGTSWGGVIATEIASRRADLVRSLVLLDSTRGSATSDERAQTMLARVDELRASGARQLAAARAPRLVSPEASAEAGQAVLDEMAQVRVAGYEQAARHMARTDTAALLPGITAPCLVLVGEHDVVTGVEESRLLADRVPGARFALVARAGHAAVSEQPEAVAREIRALWSSR